MKSSDYRTKPTVKISVDDDLPDWVMKYPEPWRRFLRSAGMDDRGIKAIEAYNYDVIEVAKASIGEPRYVLKTALDLLDEDWDGVLSRHAAESHASASKTAGDPTTEPLERGDTEAPANLGTDDGNR